MGLKQWLSCNDCQVAEKETDTNPSFFGWIFFMKFGGV